MLEFNPILTADDLIRAGACPDGVIAVIGRAERVGRRLPAALPLSLILPMLTADERKYALRPANADDGGVSGYGAGDGCSTGCSYGYSCNSYNSSGGGSGEGEYGDGDNYGYGDTYGDGYGDYGYGCSDSIGSGYSYCSDRD
jgi:hypothetical protein